MEQITSDEASCRSSLDLFTVKVVITWLIICLPGNVFPIICIYGTNDTDISSSHQKQLNFSWKQFTNNSTRAQQNITNFFWNQSLILRDLKIDPESASNETYDRIVANDYMKFSKRDAGNDSQCYEFFEEDLEIGRKRIRFWIEGVGIFVVGIFGFPCNLITIFVLRKYSMRRKNRNFNILIMCLTIADTILIIDTVWQKSIVQHFLNPQEPEWYDKTYPYIWHPLKGISLSGTIFMTVAVSTERFRSFCSPMESKISPFKYIATVMSISILSKSHRFLQFELTEDGESYQLSKLMENPTYIRFNAYWDEMAVSGFIPLFILIYLNLKIYLEIRSSKKMDSFRHRGKPKLGDVSSDLVATTSKLPTIFHANSKSAEMVNMEKIVVHKIRRSRSLSLKRHNNSSKPICLTDHTAPLMLNRKTTDGEESAFLNRKKIDAHLRTQIYKDDTLQLSRQSTIFKGLSKHNSLKQENIEGSLSVMCEKNEEVLSKQCKRKCDGNFQKRRLYMDKSTLILVIIVTFFIITHSTRMASRLYMSIYPQLLTEEHFIKCHRLNRYHVPFVLYVLNHLNSLLIVLSSSLNFIIYCCVAERFREYAAALFRKPRQRRDRNMSSLYA